MSRPFDVLVVGELNVDLLLYGVQGAPELGKEILADRMTLTMGSSSAIFAVNLASLGSRVSFVGRLGQDVFGELVASELKAGGVDTSHLIIQPDHITGATVALGWDDDRAMVTHKGAMDDLTAEDITDEMLQSAHHLHISSFFLQSGLRHGVRSLFERAHKHGLTTSFDTQWDPDEEWKDVHQVLPEADVFLPNQSEATALTGNEDAEQSAGILHQPGKVIVVKRGKDGAYMIGRDNSTHQIESHSMTVVDEVGAGDTFDAAFVHSMLKGQAEIDCLKFANAVAAFSVTTAGGTTALRDGEKLGQWLASNGIDWEMRDD